MCIADRWMVEMKEKKYYYVACDGGGGRGAHSPWNENVPCLVCGGGGTGTTGTAV